MSVKVAKGADQEKIADCYPLTPLQEGMLFHSMLDRHSGVDVGQLVCALDGGVDAAALDYAWRQLVRRHAVLRMGFHWEGLNEPYQEVWARADTHLGLRRWSSAAPDDGEQRFADYLRDDRRRGFNLNEAPLARPALFELPGGVHKFALTFHHAVLDEWSLSLILEELFARYDAVREGREMSLESPRPFRDYVEWVRAHDSSQAEKFWRAQLGGFTAPTPLLGARTPAEAVVEVDPGAQGLRLPAELSAALRAIAEQCGVKSETLALGAWLLLLSRYSGETDVACGVTRPSRPAGLDGVESIVGPLITTLPARVTVPPEMPASQWLKELQRRQDALREHERTPLVDLHKWGDVPPGGQLFESIVVLAGAPPGLKLRGRGAAPRLTDLQLLGRTGYPLTLTVHTEPGLDFSLTYDRGRFDDETIARTLGHLTALLKGLATNPGQSLGRLPLLTDAERRRLLVEWNHTARHYPGAACIHELIEAQAALTPDAVAVQFEGERLTYRGLNGRANLLGRRLQALGVGAETRVGIMLDRSPDMIAGLLGILKAGGAYVPLDPSYPAERLSFMLEDSQSPVLLTVPGLAGKLPAHAARVVYLDEVLGEGEADGAENPDSQVTWENLAYVIYTSGSTGKPKGVQITHRALVNFLHSMGEQPGLTANDLLLAVTTLSFDIAGLEIYLPLLKGARLEIVGREVASDGRRLLERLEASGATVMQATPSMWRMLVESGWRGDGRLKMLCGGEALQRDLAEQLLARGGELWNLYGPTETTIWSTACKVERGGGTVPIGRPIANTQIYVLDPLLQPVPAGVSGELHVGGAGVARGYLNRPELTAEKFIPDPLTVSQDSRLYKTGDAARYRADGQIEYLNRLDNQVKVRGFRIELGEIEAALLRHPGVGDAAVIAREDLPGGKALTAYFVPRREAAPAAGELRDFLKATLPEYMVPAFFVALESLPLTPNGKVSRRALPPPGEASGAAAKAFAAPRDALEQRLVKIWEDVLGRRPIGADDNFFELGGHSLLAVRLFIQVEDAFGKNLPLATLFQAPTVRQLADVLREQRPAPQWSSLVAIQPGGTRPPFFCVHGVGGNVLNYRALSKYLGADQPFYGLQSVGLDGNQAPLTRIEEMAARYLKEVLELQPEGPYLLGGASFGGNVAFEMARQLHGQGREVALVALFDTHPAGYSKLAPASGRSRESLSRRMKVHLTVILSGPDRLAYSRKKIRRVWRRLIYRTWQTTYRLLQRIGRQLPQSLRNVQQANYMALRDYSPETYPGVVTLFCACDEPEEFTRNMQEGWRVLAAGGVVIEAVPGDHLTMVEEPHVRTLAEKLGECINART